jgi:diguanylate cyclase (GGDEF)-like protein/PAS domain S-box-containing protein
MESRRGKKPKDSGAKANGAAGGATWRAFARRTQVGVAIVDADLRSVYANDALAPPDGHADRARRGRPIAECFGDFEPDLPALLRQVFATGEPALSVELTGARARRTGPRRNYVAHVFPLGKARAGGPRLAGVVIIDVTKQRETYESLRDCVGKYRMLMNYAPDGLLMLGPRANILDANRRAAEMLGSAAEELIGSNFRDLLAPDDGRADPLPPAGKRGGRGAALAECELRRGGRAPLPVEINVRAVGDRGGHVLAVVRDATERRAAEEKLIHGAFHDPLTGLPNRALFADRLRQSFERAGRYKDHRFAVLFLDLDNFKEINDRFGHDVGDELLKAVGARLHRSMRAGDTVARLGGDEFTILAEEAQSVEQVAQIAARIDKELRLPFRAGRYELFAAGSVGICIHDPARHRHPEDVLHGADRAMYAAKMRGKGGHAFCDEAALSARGGRHDAGRGAGGKAGAKKRR